MFSAKEARKVANQAARTLDSVSIELLSFIEERIKLAATNGEFFVVVNFAGKNIIAAQRSAIMLALQHEGYQAECEIRNYGEQKGTIFTIKWGDSGENIGYDEAL